MEKALVKIEAVVNFHVAIEGAYYADQVQFAPRIVVTNPFNSHILLLAWESDSFAQINTNMNFNMQLKECAFSFTDTPGILSNRPKQLESKRCYPYSTGENMPLKRPCLMCRQLSCPEKSSFLNCGRYSHCFGEAIQYVQFTEKVQM